MKKIILGLLVSAFLAACGGQASAASVGAETYTDGTVVFTLKNALTVDNTLPGYVNVAFTSGPGMLVADPTGSLFVKIKLNNPQLVQNSASSYWVNPNVAQKITCNGTQTIFTIFGFGNLSMTDSGCVMFNQIKANSY